MSLFVIPFSLYKLDKYQNLVVKESDDLSKFFELTEFLNPLISVESE